MSNHSTPVWHRRDVLRLGLTALLAPSVGCLGDPLAGGGSGMVRLASRPGAPSGTATPGESALGLGTGRDGLLYVPQAYDPALSWPLFVALHGATGDAAGWRGFFPAGDERGMVILVPESRGVTWDGVRGDFGPDVEFIDAALAETFSRCRIDPTRVCFGGFSDGASYALSLGVSNGDLFSHLVAFSPGFFRPGGSRAGRPRVWVSHGLQDTVLPVTGSRLRIVPTLRSEGYDVTYEEFTGGHEVPSAVARAALDWYLPDPETA